MDRTKHTADSTATPKTLWALLEQRVARAPDRELLVDEHGRRLTFAQFRDAAERVAAGLHDRGVTQGTNVSWQLPTRIEAVVLVAALSRLGAVQNPMLPTYREREIGFITRQTHARLLVVPGPGRGVDHPAMARTAAPAGLDVLVVDPDLPEGDPVALPPGPTATDPPPVRWIFYTSGTTADPKGARHTDATIEAGALAARQAIRLGPDDKVLLAFPFAHVGGLIHLRNAIDAGCLLAVVEQLDPPLVADLVAREGITVATGGPPVRALYLAEHRRRPDARRFATVRAYPGGGTTKPPGSFAEVRRHLGGLAVPMYGLTEAPNVVTGALDDPPDKLTRTEGRPAADVEIRIVTVDGAAAGAGEEGEIRVRAPQLLLGYVDGGLDADAFDDDGFFRTGDLGHRDDDGYLTITGRSKDVIIRKGENISAKEVEDLLSTHHKVADVAVVGLPDPASGERACAVVACHHTDDPLTFAEMTTHLRAQGLMVQKVPEQLELVPEIPRNASGKVLKHELRRRYGDLPAPPGEARGARREVRSRRS